MGYLLQEKVEISVVICHHTGFLIHRCLQSVRKSLQIRYEVIVVSSIAGIDLGEDILVIHSTEGPAYKRNFATHFANGKYYVFLDDDVEISPYCLYHLWQFMETHPKCGMEFCKILNMEKRDIFDDCGSWLTQTGFLWARAENEQKDIGQFEDCCRILASKSATCIVQRSCFGSVQGFDTSYFILGEETDLAWRMWLKGLEIWYNPKAVSWHAFGTSLKPKASYYTLERIHFHGCKNYINLLCTNLGWSRLSLILPIHIVLWLVASVGYLLTGQWQRSYLILKGILWNLINLKMTLTKRQAVQSKRVVTDKELFQIILHHPPLSYYLQRLIRYITQGLHG